MPKIMVSIMAGIVAGFCFATLLCYYEGGSPRRYQQAKTVGAVEACYRLAPGKSNKEFYRDWLEDLRKRGYMWGETR